MNNEHNYRQQFEDQVKALIAQYLQTHGEFPAVTIEWGKGGVDLKKLEEEVDSIINDPNFVPDFEEFLKSKEAPATPELESEVSKDKTIKAYGLTTRVWILHPKYGYGCSECCTGDRCDEDCTARYKRSNCPHCKGKGWIPKEDVIIEQEPEPATHPDPEAKVVPKSQSRIAVCNACSNEKHGVKTRIAVKHTCGK